MGKSHRGKCNRCQQWMTWAAMPDGKRLPFDETGEFLLTPRGQGEDEYMQAIAIAKRHHCFSSGAPEGADSKAPDPSSRPDGGEGDPEDLI